MAATRAQGGGEKSKRTNDIGYTYGASLTAGLGLTAGLEVVDVGKQALFLYVGVGVGAGITYAGSVGSTDSSEDGGGSVGINGAVGQVYDTATNADYEGVFISFTGGFSFMIGIRTPVGSGGISRGLVRTIAYSPNPNAADMSKYSHTLTDYMLGLPFGDAKGQPALAASATFKGGIGVSYYKEVFRF